MDKTCESGGVCHYRYQSSGLIGWGCSYTGYCDFQRPRDSRLAIPYKQPENKEKDKFDGY